MHCEDPLFISPGPRQQNACRQRQLRGCNAVKNCLYLTTLVDFIFGTRITHEKHVHFVTKGKNKLQHSCCKEILGKSPLCAFEAKQA